MSLPHTSEPQGEQVSEVADEGQIPRGYSTTDDGRPINFFTMEK